MDDNQHHRIHLDRETPEAQAARYEKAMQTHRDQAVRLSHGYYLNARAHADSAADHAVMAAASARQASRMAWIASAWCLLTLVLHAVLWWVG